MNSTDSAFMRPALDSGFWIWIKIWMRVWWLCGMSTASIRVTHWSPPLLVRVGVEWLTGLGVLEGD